MGAEELARAQAQLIARVATKLRVGESPAAVLLQHSRWSETRLLAALLKRVISSHDSVLIFSQSNETIAALLQSACVRSVHGGASSLTGKTKIDEREKLERAEQSQSSTAAASTTPVLTGHCIR